METSIVCRACLTTISLEYIDLESPLYDDVTFLDCFNYCTKLQANLEDEFPNNICVACGRSLQIAYDFIKASVGADRVFRDSLFFFEDLHNIEESKNVSDVDAIIKTEDNNVDLTYPAEYVEDVDEIKVEYIKELPEFEVVISNEDDETGEIKNMGLSTEENVTSWPISCEEDEDQWRNNVEALKCEICEQIIPKDEYENHTNIHSDSRPYKCDECDENFFSEKYMEMHKKAKHRSKQRENYVCGWCGEAFNCRSKLINHRVIDHQGKVPNSCLTCGDKFSDEPGLRRHVKKAHGISRKPVACPYCNKEYKAIALHIKANHPDILRLPIPNEGDVQLSKNQCPYCFRVCLSQNILNDHINTHTGEKPYSCGVCEKAFHQKNIRDRHEFAVHQSKDGPVEKCNLCKFSTNNILSMRSHKARHRRPVEKKYLCAYCPMIFVNPKKLHMHEDLRHGTGEKAYQCEICQKKFIIMRKLKEHIMCVHVSGRPHECPECKKTFKNDFQLKAHQKLHTGKQIDCPQCDKKFARRVDFKIHMRTHTGELPYECHLCDKRYAIKVRLTYHLQRHMDFKHKCQHCSGEYNSRAKLRLHMFKHIGMPYVCDHCQMGYPNRIGLRRHSKNVHKIILTADDLLANRRKNAGNVRNEIGNAPSLQPISGLVDEFEI